MSRLIDADEFKKNVSHMWASEKYELTEASGMMELIDAQPTAYDVDKVVKQLFDLQNECIDMDNMGKAEACANAMEIVKAGGINE